MTSGQIAFVRRSASTEDQGIFVIINGGPPEGLTGGYEPALSPDGSLVAFRRSHGEGETEIDVVNTDGNGFRTLTKIAGNPLELAPAWSPDGKRLAFASGGDLYVMNADGSGQHKIIELPPGFVVPAEPSWSPDGSKLLYIAASDNDNLTSIHLIGADGSNDVVFKQMPLMDYRTPSWSPDGTNILFAAAAFMGPYVFDLYVMDADGSAVRRLTHTADVSESEPVWSPDGTQIAFGRDAGRGHVDIYVMNADGSGLRPLTRDSSDELSPTWGPVPP
jgi:Tol biopolymer transport system component